MLRFFLSLFVIFANLIMAQEAPPSKLLEDSICKTIFEEQPNSILFSTESKMYLRSEHLHATDQGLFLGDERSFVELPCLFADSLGCYIPKNFRKAGYYICWNPKCSHYGGVFHNTTGECP